jgi:beta-fructofuranosidase
MSFLYKPSDGVAADFIPFYWKGEYHLFYLKDYRDLQRHGEGTPWFHLVSHDFVHFEDWGEILPRGSVEEQDLYVFTGSTIERGGVFHIFYTGHNPHMRQAAKPEQGVMHAASPDLRTWKKDAAFISFAPQEMGYEANDWRDPFVFWNETAGEYWMLLAARKQVGPSRQRGLTACMSSVDLQHWQVRPPFWAPDLYYTHECPDLFHLGDWWYLVYSTFSERCVTHYRMSRSLEGPWLAPGDDTFDGRAYYAAKTASDGQRRFIFGWLPTRSSEKDDGDWNWGGNLVVHELQQQPDGRLTVKPPQTVIDAFRSTLPLQPQAVLGAWLTQGQTITGGTVGQAASMLLGEVPETCVIETEVSFSPGVANFGLLLHADAALDHYYALRFEPANQRMVFDRWPRPGDQPFMLERPLSLEAGKPITIRVVLDGTCVVAYAGDQALSCRMYEHRAGQLGLFANEGEASFSHIAAAGLSI